MTIRSMRQSFKKRCPFCGSEQVVSSKSGKDIMDCVCGEKFQMKRGHEEKVT